MVRQNLARPSCSTASTATRVRAPGTLPGPAGRVPHLEANALLVAQATRARCSAAPHLSRLKSAFGESSYLPQGFAFLTAAESQSLVYARRSVGGLGRGLSAQRGLDGVEFGPRAAELRALHHQHRGQEQEAAGRVPAPHPRGHLPAGGEEFGDAQSPEGCRGVRRRCAPTLASPGTQDPENHAVSAVARSECDPSQAGSPAGQGGAAVTGGGHSLGAVPAEEEEEA